MTWQMAYPGQESMLLKKNGFCYCPREVFYKCLLGQVDSVVQVFCGLADYLSGVSVFYFKLQITVLVPQ